MGSSDAVAAAAAADPLSGAGHASVIEQLQLQAVQAATSGGVLLEQIASSNDEPESGAPVQLKGPEQMRAALAQLRQLQQAGSQHAEKLQVTCSGMHAVACDKHGEALITSRFNSRWPEARFPAESAFKLSVLQQQGTRQLD